MHANRSVTRLAALLLSSAAGLALAHPAQAQSRWDGSADSDYNNPDNWTPAGVPGSATQVVIDDETNAPVIGTGETGAARAIGVGVAATGTLTIRDGGALILGDVANGGSLSIGGSPTTAATGGNGTVLVTGANSVIRNPTSGITLEIAVTTDSTGVLDIRDGASVVSSSGRLGSAANSSGTITVTGPGSNWTIASGTAGISLGNGNFRDANGLPTARGFLNILDGGSVSYPGGVGWTVAAGSAITIDGAGSSLTVPTALTMGGNMTVSGGGSAVIDTLRLGDPQIANFLTVSGAGSQLTANSFIGGLGGHDVTILVEDGGSLLTDEAPIAGLVGGATAEITVTGVDSLWRIAADASTNPVIGAGANVASLNVLAGGRVESLTRFNMTIGQGASVHLSDAGSTLDIAGNIGISASSPGQPVGSFVIENGATLITRGPSDNGLGFGAVRDMEIRSGGSWIMTGGANSGLQIETTNLLVDGGTLSAQGNVSIGLRFSGTRLTLVDADFTARQLNIGSVGDNIVSIGGVRGGPAGAAGIFAVGSVGLSGANTLVLNHSEQDYVIPSIFSGSVNALIEHLAGETIFSGVGGGFGGGLDIAGGSLRINGSFGGSSSVANVHGGATLGGSGLFGGSVSVTDGAIAPGNSPGTLTINGDLALGSGSHLLFELGAPGGVSGIDSDLIDVGGNLVLDGSLDVTDAGGFGSGLYRLINYGGSLTDNGLQIDSIPAAFATAGFTVDVATAGQVNLLVGAPALDFIFWDGGNSSANGGIDGGSGIWSVDGTNWTIANGSVNGVYDPADFLIFSGPSLPPSALARSLAAATPGASAGTVTVDGESDDVTLENGVQFAVDGYTIVGDSLGLVGGEILFRVGDGSLAGQGFIATVTSVLTGDGGLAKTDLGTLILQGANDYTGGTRVASGTLQGDTTSLQGAIAVEQDGTLLFDQAAAGSYAGVLSGTGSIVKEGAGTLQLTGDSSGFIGLATLSEGGLDLRGSLGGNLAGSSLVTLAGTRLTGNGQSASLDLSGILAPGTGAATFTVDGTATFRAGSTYEVDLAASGASDLLVASDDVVIEGGTVSVNLLDPDTAYTDGSVYIIAEAGGGLSGTFDGLVENSAFLDFTLGYSSSTAFLTLALVQSFPDVALTFNQRQASLGLMELEQAPGSDGLAVYNSLLLLGAEQARAAFDLASGEIYADLLAGGQRGAQARSAALLMRGLETGKPGWDAWIAAGGAHGSVADDGNGARFTRDGHALELGLDYHAPDNQWALGISGGWADSDMENSARASQAELDGWFASGFARYGNFGAGLTAALAASYRDSSGDAVRAIDFGSVSRVATARVGTSSTTVAMDLRFGFAAGDWAFGPAAGVEHARTTLDGFSESGAGALSLSSSGARDSWTRASAGGFVSYSGENARLLLDLRYAAGAADDSFAEFRLAGSPRSFTILPARGSKDGVRIAGNGEVGLGGNWSLGGELSALLAGEENAVAGHAWLRLRF